MLISRPKPPSVRIFHNLYKLPGGEERVAAAECSLLRNNGHDVDIHYVSNNNIDAKLALSLAWKSTYHPAAIRRVRESMPATPPDIVHFHNTFPLLSPGVYAAVRDTGAAVVQTIHNYRIVCPGSNLWRNGRGCESCLGGLGKIPALVYGCYRSSRLATLPVVAMISVHHLLGTWDKHVDAYIALTAFGKEKLVAGGLPEDRVFVKPNFLFTDPETGDGGRGDVLFAGRLTEAKGIQTLLEAWSTLSGRYDLTIVGDGPLRDVVSGFCAKTPRTRWLGHIEHAEVIELMRSARLVAVPSLGQESFSLTTIESLSVGTPVVVSEIGPLPQVAGAPTASRSFRPGDATDLATQMKLLMDSDGEYSEMRKQARLHYEANFKAEPNYSTLMSIYDFAIQRRTQRAVRW